MGPTMAPSWESVNEQEELKTFSVQNKGGFEKYFRLELQLLKFALGIQLTLKCERLEKAVPIDLH